VKTVRKPAYVSQTSDDGKYAMSELEQQDAARELENLQQEELSARLSGVESGRLTELRARMDEIKTEFSVAEAMEGQGSRSTTAREAKVTPPSFVGRLAMRLSPKVARALDGMGLINATGRREEQDFVQIHTGPTISEEARNRLN
jgi:hypothetical protein